MLQPAERPCIFPGHGNRDLESGGLARAVAGVVMGEERQVAGLEVTGVELTEQSAHDGRIRRGRGRMARAILVVAGVSLVIGLANLIHEATTAKDAWRARLISGE